MYRFFIGFFIFLPFCLIGQPTGNFVSYENELYFKTDMFFDREQLFLADIEVKKILSDSSFSSFYDRAMLLESEIFLKEGNYVIVEQKIQDFIKERANSPLVPFAYYSLARTSFQRQKYDYASDYFGKCKRESLKNYEYNKNIKYNELAHLSSYWQAISVAHNNSYKESKEIFNETIEIDPQGIYADDAVFALGQISELHKEYDEAIKHYRDVRLQYPSSDNYLRSLIRESANHLTLRDVKSATASIEKANSIWSHINDKDSIGLMLEKQVGLDHSLEEILYLRGEISALSGNFENALTYYNSFLETFSQSSLKYQVLLGKGYSLLNLGKNEDALIAYNKIINELKNDDYNTLSLARLYKVIALKRSGNLEVAEREMSALSLNSGYPFVGVVLMELGQLHYEKGDMELARRFLERGIKESYDTKTDIRLNLLLGAVYINMGLWENAISTYQNAENLAKNADPKFVPFKDWYIDEARFKQGVAYVQNGRTALAIKPLSAFLSSQSTDERKAEAYFWLAEAYFASDLLTNSAQTYKALLDKYPAHIRREDAIYGLGWSHFRQKNFNQSSKVFDQLVNEYPKSNYAVEVLARQADGYYIIKDYNKAAETYGRVVKNYPSSDEGEYSAYQLCHAYYRMGKYENAVNSLFGFVRKYDKSQLAANAMYLIAWIRLQQKRYDETISNLEYLIEAFPNSDFLARSHYTIGDAYYNKGDYEKSMQSYRKVIDSYPTSSLAPESMKGIQNCLVLLGREDEAIEIIDVYTGKNDKSPFAYDFMTRKARLQFDSRRYGEAIDEYNKIVDKYPDKEENAEAIYWIARSYINMEETQQAENAFIKLEKQFPNSEYAPLGLLQYGLLSKNLSNPQKADSIFLKLEEKYPSSEVSSQSGFERAIIYYTMGDTAKSINTYKDIANNYGLNDYTVEARYRVAMYYKNKNEKDSALFHFGFLSMQDFNLDFAAEANYRIGEIWKVDKYYEFAIGSYNIVKEKYSNFEDWYSLSVLSLGEIYEQNEDWVNASENYRILVEIRSDDDFGKTAASRLKRIEKFIKK